MNRRNAIARLGLGTTGLLLFPPAWASNWTAQRLPTVPPLFTDGERATLVELAETIIPATTTPGARALGVGAYIETILSDCYAPPMQQVVRRGLEMVNTLARQQGAADYATLPPARKLVLLEGFTRVAPDSVAFYDQLKILVIQGYKTSEFYQTTIAHYELVPGRFHGRVRIKP